MITWNADNGAAVSLDLGKGSDQQVKLVQNIADAIPNTGV